MGLQEAVARILQRTPGVAQHPELLLSALNHFNDLGILDPEAQTRVAEATKLPTMERVAAAHGISTGQEGAPAATPAEPAVPPMPTATNPQTGAKIQWDGKAWQPMTP